MAAGRTAARVGFSPGLAVFLIAAVAFGAAASLLAAPSTAPTYVLSGTSNSNSSGAVLQLGGLVIIGAVGAWLVYRVAKFTPMPGHTIALGTCLVIFLFCIGFLVAAHYVGGAPGAASRTQIGHNGTGGKGVPPGPGSIGNNGSGNGTGVPPTWFSFPVWLPYAVLLGGVTVAVLVALPFAVAVMREREQKPPPLETRESIRSTITQAIRDLDAMASMDPRRRIIAVYAQLLARIDAGKGGLEALTAREIEVECTTRLRVTPATAHELTNLFEEARYSSHPMTEPSVERARAALNRALADLDAPSVLA
ncbi:MAG: DUF4129 domain-containing protein [Thermoplasmata archaeon]|nr:DUF4129 domain-containing protein [Thermoplasmata archaeon]